MIKTSFKRRARVEKTVEKRRLKFTSDFCDSAVVVNKENYFLTKV